MKRLLLLFILILNNSFSSVAQDYQLFFSNRFYIFEYQTGGNGHFVLFKSDSVYISGGDSVFSNYKCWDDDMEYTIPISTFSASYNDLSWIGNKCIIKSDKQNILLTNNSLDSIFFKPEAQLGDTWIFYKFPNGDKYTALISSIVSDSVLGVIDSVKTITIHKFDSSGTAVNDTLNNFDFKLSKQFGLLRTVNFKHFPHQINVYQLKGIDSIAGDQRITPLSIFNFDVGDEFHYSSTPQHTSSIYYSVIEKKKILSKTTSPTSVTYSVDDSTYTQTNFPFGVDTSYFRHSVNTETYTTNLNSLSYLCKIIPHSYDTLYTNNGVRYITTWNRVRGRRGIYTTSCISWGGLFTSIYRSLGNCTGNYCNYPNGSNWFVEGLGHTYQFSNLDSVSGTNTCFKILVYYKKTNDVYGTSVVFPAITTDVKNIFSKTLNLFPNPADDVAFVENPGSFYDIKLFDSRMKLVQPQMFIENEKIKIYCSNLDSGIYIVVMTKNDSKIFSKLIVAHK